MDLLFSLPVLKDVPKPNFYADITDKYDKFEQIKYFLHCKRLILQQMDLIHSEFSILQSAIRTNISLGYSCTYEYFQIHKNEWELHIYGQSCEFISIILNQLWWQIRTLPPC